MLSRHVVVTGGAGFIGSNFVDFLNSRSPSTRVTVFDDFSTGVRANLLGSDCEIVASTVLDYPALERAFSGADSVVHLAAIGSVPRSVAAPMETHEANATGTLNVLEAARSVGVRHVIVASSSSVYGSNPTLPKQELEWTRPMSPYATSKLAAEAYALAYTFSYGLKTLALRFFNVYGPRQRADHPYAAVIPRFIDATLSGTPLIVNGDGLQSRDFTFVESVCSALYDAVVRELDHSQPVNVAFGTRTTLLELAVELEKQTGRSLVLKHGDVRVGDVRNSFADPRMFRSLFPGEKQLPLATGLKKTLDWHTSLTD